MDTLLEMPFLQVLAIQWGVNLFRYFFIAGGAWLVFWKWFYPKLRERSLYPETPARRHRKREILYSVLTTIIFLGPVALVIGTRDMGISKVYSHISDYGWGWALMSYFVLYAWHDTYFYWVHRFMHWKPIYRRVHHVHHLSREPTPFTAFSFHPLEAILESLPIALAALVLPFHVGTLAIFSLFSVVMNVYGHLGIEIFDHKKAPWTFVNSPRYHTWHHQQYLGNYSLYTNFWDRLMGTAHFETKKSVGRASSGTGEAISDRKPNT
jgi:sterol desaturase/sphingolipid hydroxylase (fatty acid hydroxylase superfamily)